MSYKHCNLIFIYTFVWFEPVAQKSTTTAHKMDTWKKKPKMQETLAAQRVMSNNNIPKAHKVLLVI